MTTNKKAATSGKARAASRLHCTLNFISTSAWRLACCIGLTALRLLTGGLHHV